MARPVIGITCSRSIGGRWSDYSLGHFKEFAFDVYSRAVLNCGGAPLLVPISQNKKSLAAVCGVLDGLILSGGPDINPRFYGEAPHSGLKDVDEAQDEMEIALTRQILSAGLPVLGICRGMQLLNVVLGGTLYQDIPQQIPKAFNHAAHADRSIVTHQVEISIGSLLHQIIGRRTLWVNSNHHQAVKSPPPELVVSAAASDGVIEAVEDPRRPFLLAVQWHPEGLWFKDASAKRLFKALVAAASK